VTDKIMPIIAGAKKPLSAPCIADDEVIAYRIDEKHKSSSTVATKTGLATD